jgi:hypothetical protein
MASKMALKSSPGEDPLMLSLGVQGLHWRYQKADGVTDLNEVSAKVEVGFDTGVWLPYACTMTFNGVGYQEAAEFNASIEREIDSKVLHDAGDIPYSRTGDPKVHYEGNPKVAMDVMLPLKNRNIIELLADDTEFEASWVYARGTYEELTVCMQGCHLNGPLMDEWPEEGAIPQNADCIARKMYIQVKDFVPYYVA